MVFSLLRVLGSSVNQFEDLITFLATVLDRVSEPTSPERSRQDAARKGQGRVVEAELCQDTPSPRDLLGSEQQS